MDDMMLDPCIQSATSNEAFNSVQRKGKATSRNDGQSLSRERNDDSVNEITYRAY